MKYDHTTIKSFDDVASIVTDPPESVDFDRAERGLDVIATFMTDDEFNAVADFIDRMRNQELISRDVYITATDALNRVHKEIYEKNSIDSHP